MKKDAKNSKGSDPSPGPSHISDPRFASFETNPRFRLPSKKKSKTTIDKRFSRMLHDDEFTTTARVDRYGRKIKSDAKKKALQRLYEEEEEEEEDGDKEGSDRDREVEVDDDEVVQRELRAAHEKYDPARGGGFSSASDSDDDSDSDSDDDSDSDSDDEEQGSDDGNDAAAASTSTNMQRFQDEQANVEDGEVTKRIAIVNLDWDHVKSTDLFALFSSFLPPGTGDKVDKVSVYPSEFGKERMQQEEVEGPPKELFKSRRNDDSDSESDSDSDSDSEDDDDEKIKKELIQEGNDEDFDHDALRAYQLDRLRYYYAVMECSSATAAKKIYDATDGTEFQSSSNFLDLRFVPDDVDFDDEPRDSCDALPKSYRPVEFVTNALQSSKVKLTWDMHPEEISRKETINRAFSGTRNEIEENDLKAYLASDNDSDDDDDDDDEEEEEAQGGEEGAPKLSKKELQRKKMREALGLTDEPTAKDSKDGPVGGMEITFTPALTGTKKSKSEDKEETTIEKYKRKERERKERKRQEAKARREGRHAGVDADSNDDGDDDDDEDGGAMLAGEGDEGKEDLGFDDPFFTMPDDATAAGSKSKTAVRKEERLKKRAEREAAEAEAAAYKARLSKVMAADDTDQAGQADHLDHFDMNDIVKAEKHRGKKGKGKGKKGAAAKVEAIEKQGNLQKGFEMDVTDDRFKAVFDSHEFAIDPSNPKFKATEGMKKLLDEGRKKRSRGDEDAEGSGSKKNKKGRR
ncbi:hypothetical protein GMORB2_6576 [Geosmithia morbida]|uniref:NUC153 domain-containing protein n=1 Tax=Geosmithia morbida TaxID=1094350 RepID=A0A9P4YWM0_9HYPO|nr:uncharacterized protein GMORB2_6576 [Geosmithia morbida]KAF4123028.1 hypothetical protein GMORB2_6576 [Geosmithia morbida]